MQTKRAFRSGVLVGVLFMKAAQAVNGLITLANPTLV